MSWISTWISLSFLHPLLPISAEIPRLIKAASVPKIKIQPHIGTGNS